MKVVGHQGPCKAFGTGPDQKLREAFEESHSVGIIAEDVAAVHAADDYVLQEVGYVKAGGSWHGGRIAVGWMLVN